MKEFDSPEEKDIFENSEVNDNKENNLNGDVSKNTDAEPEASAAGAETADAEDEEHADVNNNAEDPSQTDDYDESSDDADSASDENTAESEETYDYKVAQKIKGDLSVIGKKIASDSKKKFIKNIVMILLAITFVLLILFDYIPILPNAYHRSYVGNTYTVGQTQSSDFDKFGDSVIYASNGSVMCFGPDMSLQSKINAYSGVPIVRTNGSYAIIYYKNSKNVLYISDKQNYRKSQASDTILSASVNKRGYYILVTTESGYNACLTAYDKSNKSIYKWHTNYDIIDSALSPDGKHMVAAVLDYSDTGVCSKLIFFDTTETKPIKEVKCDNNVVSEVYYFDNDNFIAFGNSYTAGFNSIGTQKWRIDYSGKNLKTYDIDSDGQFGLVFNKYNSDLSDSTVEIYNTDGKRKGLYNSKNNVRYISANNGYYLLSLDKETVLLDNGGVVVKIKDTDADFQKAVLYKNYNFAFSITDSVATLMSVKH